MTLSKNGTLEELHAFCKERGFFYSFEQLFSFYISLKTKPFVILSGISGSGKSKIADLFAEYMGRVTDTDRNYELVSVKPNWTDNRGIFGFHNIINNTYEITPTLKLFIRALENPEKPYFLLLDEMNLAKVEYYFSDFLSLIESRRLIKTTDASKILNKFSDKLKLSEAIILSALQLQPDDYQKVEYYRNAPICQKWLEKKSTKNKQEQFRTELNQNRNNGPNGIKTDGSRLAGKAFQARNEGNLYKLKDLEDMDDETRSKVLKLKESLSELKQDKISLHSANVPLPTVVGQCNYTDSFIDDEGNYFVPSAIEIPPNIFVIGTVNVDETTYMFSPKVLDRSNVIEYNDIDLYGAYNYGEYQSDVRKITSNISLQLTIADSAITRNLCTKHPDTFSRIVEIYNVLKKHNKHFGYRVFNEISSFILNYITESNNISLINDALDIQVVQKVLPKLNGTEEEILDVLQEIYGVVNKYELKYSVLKLNKMISTLHRTGYVTFIE